MAPAGRGRGRGRTEGWRAVKGSGQKDGTVDGRSTLTVRATVAKGPADVKPSRDGSPGLSWLPCEDLIWHRRGRGAGAFPAATWWWERAACALSNALPAPPGRTGVVPS